MERPLFDKSGGFRRLHSFTLATVIRMETRKFCRRFMTHNWREHETKYYDPTGRQYDQMTQAAREGLRDADAPACPTCEKPMRVRHSAKGEFWGCTAYPECKGTRPK